MRKIVRAEDENTPPGDGNAPDTRETVIKRLQSSLQERSQELEYDIKNLERATGGGNPTEIAFFERQLMLGEKDVQRAQEHLDRFMKNEPASETPEEDETDKVEEHPLEEGEFKIKKEDLAGIKDYRMGLIKDINGKVAEEVGTNDFAKLDETDPKFTTLAVYNSIKTFITAYDSPPPGEEYKSFLGNELDRRLKGYERIIQGGFPDEDVRSAQIAYNITGGFLDYLNENNKKGGN
jgi:hypothetical protein